MHTEQGVDALASFDWTAFESPSAAVVTTVAEEAGSDPADLDHLYDTIDPDSLDQLVTSMSSSFDSPNGSLEFAYHDYWVVLKAHGRGYVHDYEDRPQSTLEPRQVEAASRTK